MNTYVSTRGGEERLNAAQAVIRGLSGNKGLFVPEVFPQLPVSIEENYFSRSYSFLLSEDLEGSLYKVLAAHGVQIGNSEKTLGICYATREQAQLLSVAEGEALLQMQDLVYDGNGAPLFSGREIVDAGRFEYRIHQEA